MAQRVAAIQNSSVPISWRYVPTKCNPADVTSRGILATEFKNHSLWWEGPTWWEQSSDNWSFSQTLAEDSNVNLEIKSNVIVNIVALLIF